MSTPQSRLDIDRIMRAADAPKAILILFNPTDDGQLEPEIATKGIGDPEEEFYLLAQVASQQATDIFQNLSAEMQRLPIALPTAEQARQFGIVRKPRA